jgi:hypothetical protein
VLRLIEDKYKDVIFNWEKTPVQNAAFILPVVGIFVQGRINLIHNLNIGDSLKICRDHKNSYDSNAIKVMNDHDEQIGFIAARGAFFSTKLDEGFTYDIKLSKKDIDKSCIYKP